MDEAEEVLDVILPSGDESAKVVHPGKEPFHLPTFLVASQRASILRLAASAAPALGEEKSKVILRKGASEGSDEYHTVVVHQN